MLDTSEFNGRFGFGAMRLPMRDGEPDFELCNQMFDRFLEAGLNYFDTAHVYLGGKSEVALRESLVSRHPRESLFIVDKLTHGTFRDPASIRKVFQEELDACGVGYFDLLLAHAVNKAHYEMYERQGVFETAKELVAEGRARWEGMPRCRRRQFRAPERAWGRRARPHPATVNPALLAEGSRLHKDSHRCPRQLGFYHF